MHEAENFLICPDCGNLREFCSTPDALGELYPQRRICYTSMAQAAADRRYGEKHEQAPFHNGLFEGWSKDPKPLSPFHFRDGVHVWTAREDLGDDFI